jgi:hypothetical protein
MVTVSPESTFATTSYKTGCSSDLGKKQRPDCKSTSFPASLYSSIGEIWIPAQCGTGVETCPDFFTENVKKPVHYPDFYVPQFLKR